jgi:hypothetical protein
MGGKSGQEKNGREKIGEKCGSMCSRSPRKFVHLSSMAILGFFRSISIRSETDPPSSITYPWKRLSNFSDKLEPTSSLISIQVTLFNTSRFKKSRFPKVHPKELKLNGKKRLLQSHLVATSSNLLTWILQILSTSSHIIVATTHSKNI